MTPQRVGTLAHVALVLAVAGGLLAVSSPHLGPRLAVGATVALAGVVLAVSCLRHGARHEHERGRYAAWLAVLLGLLLVLLPVWGATRGPYL